MAWVLSATSNTFFKFFSFETLYKGNSKVKSLTAKVAFALSQHSHLSFDARNKNEFFGHKDH